MTSSTTFTSCMHDQMLESNRDDVKLEAMRCVTVMTAKGKLTVPRTLFPHIVKNVSSKNPELKKLIYLYLTSFADQEPDLALLPVATLQKSLKSPNPLIRSSALKVLTSMRLNILSAILMATLRNSVNDLSPYVRKTVAHAIIKIYRLDPSLRGDLIEYIERLFNDKNSMVLSSAVATFEVVCPEKLELVQKHYRRFCFILADCSEWGQTVMLNLLMRYILKTYGQSNTEANYNPADHDPKVLLRSAKPLSHSNNSAVVMAVIKLYIAVAHHNEVRSTITKPLLRLLYSHREIQLVVLNMIEELTSMKDSNMSRAEADKTNHIDEGSSKDQQSTHESETATPSTLNGDLVNYESSQPLDTEHITKDGYIPLDSDSVVPASNSSNAYQSIQGSSGLTEEDRSFNKERNNTEIRLNETLIENKPSNEKRNIETAETEKVDVEESEEDDDDEQEDEECEEEGDDEDEESDEEEDDEDDEDEEESEDDIKETRNGPSKDIDDKKDFDSTMVDLSANKDPETYREIFRPYIKSFYVKHNDCTQVRLAKLRILTNLSSSVNVSQILRELQAYVAIYVEDKEFVSAAIQAIGRCAIIVKEVAHTCLNGLTKLLSNNNEHIVSEAIVVLRSQIMNKRHNLTSTSADESIVKGQVQSDEGTKEADNQDKESVKSNEEDDKIVSTVIKQVTKLLPTVTAPQARATILWILAEFCDKNITAAKCAPEVLRSIAKTFCHEDNFVKLQSLTLISKFLLFIDKEKRPELYQKAQLLATYFFSLAKYDINHDVRDRGRFLKKLLEDEDLCAKVLLSGVDREKQGKHAIHAV